MKTIETGGITFIQPVPEGTAEWYYGIDRGHGDLYEAEEIVRSGGEARGNSLCLIHYPDGAVFRPVPQQKGSYFGEPAYEDGGIFLLQVDFTNAVIRIFRFDGTSHETARMAELPLSTVRDCYNLRLHTAPVCLTRQGGEDRFQILWPDQADFPLEEHESFFLRDGAKLYFNKWFEEGSGSGYRYWEETAVRNLSGDLLETLPGDVRVMPDGQVWHLQ